MLCFKYRLAHLQLRGFFFFHVTEVRSPLKDDAVSSFVSSFDTPLSWEVSTLLALRMPISLISISCKRSVNYFTCKQAVQLNT